MIRCLVILFLSLFGLISISTFAIHSEDKQNKINLALRQTGHYLMLSQGDSTSTIPPIEYVGETGYLLRLENEIDYEKLPQFMEIAFSDYDIQGTYEVVVKDCNNDQPFLGFNNIAVQNDTIPCGTRVQEKRCANILVQFSSIQASTSDKDKSPSSTNWQFFLFLPILGIGGFLFWKRNREGNTVPNSDNDFIKIGDFNFHPEEQTLTLNDKKKDLTYRENKLLRFLVSQPNKVLTRDEILAAVWEDEGVVVGRSLDVFISRLRKLLKEDETIKIKNVHGVGYRFEMN